MADVARSWTDMESSEGGDEDNGGDVSGWLDGSNLVKGNKRQPSDSAEGGDSEEERHGQTQKKKKKTACSFSGIMQTTTDEDSFWEEDVGGEGEDDSDLSHEGHECSSERTSGWWSLPDLCLRHVFSHLSARDRKRADLVCHHWHKVMRSPSLWRSQCFYFSGRQTESGSAVTYVRSLGVHLQRLEVHVNHPRGPIVAQQLEQTIRWLLFNLTSVDAQLQSFSLIMLELDRPAWNLRLKESLVRCLIDFFQGGSQTLTSVCLNRMHNNMSQGLQLLSALSRSQRSLSSLDLTGFFSRDVDVHRNPNVLDFLPYLQGLTDLSLSYSCLSDELLTVLQHREPGSSALQTLSLYYMEREHQQLVSGGSWATLASSCPDLKVKLAVDHVTSIDSLAQILLPEIPLTGYTMEAFYCICDGWSVKPILRDKLPQYRRSLQYLTLDLNYCGESLDEELLELVMACEHLEQLTVGAYLQHVSTVERLLGIRRTQRHSLNKIRLSIYSRSGDRETEDQLKEMLSSHLHLPSELEFHAAVNFPMDEWRSG